MGNCDNERKECVVATSINDERDARLIEAAPELYDALKTFLAHYDDLAKSNPGFMGKLCLQDYGLWNEALLKSKRAIAKVERP